MIKQLYCSCYLILQGGAVMDIVIKGKWLSDKAKKVLHILRAGNNDITQLFNEFLESILDEKEKVA